MPSHSGQDNPGLANGLRRKKGERLDRDAEPIQRRQRKFQELAGGQGGTIRVDGLSERQVHPGRAEVTQGCPRKVSAYATGEGCVPDFALVKSSEFFASADRPAKLETDL